MSTRHLPADTLWFNGIDGDTGGYLVPPQSLSRIAAIARDRQVPDQASIPEKVAHLRATAHKLLKSHYGLPLGCRPEVVSEAGWAVVFHADEDPAVRRALQPLIEHRRQQVGAERCRVLEYREGESWSQWLARHEVAAGAVEPERVPLYLMVVGSPARVPFDFTQQLDIEYAVGRLHFDGPAEYASYVSSVLGYETASAAPARKEVVFFGTRHDFDRATQLSADLLVEPLADGLPAEGSRPATRGVAERWKFRAQKLLGEAATKQALSAVLTRPAGELPALLFTATHGMGWRAGDPKQAQEQGALVCQDWPGLGSIRADHYFSAADVPAAAQLRGLIAFLFACFGAGTPSHDRFLHEPGQQPARIADPPFLAALPKRLLSNPGGGALVCIGHVERAWGVSIAAPGTRPQLLPFENAIGRILLGQPVGCALKDFNEKFATLSSDLCGILEKIRCGLRVPDEELAELWTSRNDAEGYALIGDPAIQLRVADLR